jgi:putative NIF3 family GTP cyclohydrolase 1 type 2
MRKLLTIFFVGVSSCLVADDFSVVQANLKRASEIRAETAEMQLQALHEVENLNLLISGDLCQETAILAKNLQITLIDLGHHESEVPGLYKLREVLSQLNIDIEVIDKNPIRKLW